jgi:hypothetical protein
MKHLVHVMVVKEKHHSITSPSRTLQDLHARSHGFYLQACAYFAFFWGAALFNLLFSLALIGLVLYTTVFYLMVTRIVEGVTVPAKSKIRSGVAGDAVVAVSDLAATAAMLSLAVPDPMAVPASTVYWTHLITPGGTTSLVRSFPEPEYACFDYLLLVLCSRSGDDDLSQYLTMIHQDVTRISSVSYPELCHIHCL